MNDDMFDDSDAGWDTPPEPQSEPPRLRTRRRRFNPDRIRHRIAQRARVKGGLPTRANKPTKEMTLRKAKKLIYGARTPGRPSKLLSDQLREAKKILQGAGLPLQRKVAKPPAIRGRGRPKKTITVKKEKRPRGRPRKNPTVLVKQKRPRGRPRKLSSLPPKAKRPRGRPRKNPLQQLVESSKKRLPRKNQGDGTQTE